MKKNITLVGIAKNEAPYLLEWIAHHKALGFDCIRIYTNDCTDQSVDLLKRLTQELSWLEHKDWPRVGDAPPQHGAYKDALKELGESSDWICYLDLDEFLALKQHSNVSDFLDVFENCDGIAINWRVFGGSNQVDYVPKLVLERFFQASPSGAIINRCVKSFVRPDSVVSPNIHVHFLKQGSTYLYTDMTPVPEICFTSQPDLHASSEYAHISTALAQINHYHVKSRVEYEYKLKKGRATKPQSDPSSRFKSHLPQSWEEYNSGGLNAEIDRTAFLNLEKVKAVIDSLLKVVYGGADISIENFLLRLNIFQYGSLLGLEQRDTIPWVPALESAHVEQRLKDSKVFLEYGAGQSTMLAGTLAVKNIYSVESDKEWLATVGYRFFSKFIDSEFTPVAINIGETETYGYPKHRTAALNFPQYAFAVWSLMESGSISPDLILIDGRFRVSCFLASIAFAKPNTIILFDDYTERPWYKIVENIICPEKIVGRLAEFRRPDSVDLLSVIGLLPQYVNDPA
jgi:hypothetical protein